MGQPPVGRKKAQGPLRGRPGSAERCSGIQEVIKERCLFLNGGRVEQELSRVGEGAAPASLVCDLFEGYF